MEITIYEDNIDENGIFIIDRYIEYFMKHLQNRIDMDGKTYLEGEEASYRFLDNLTPNLFHSPEFERWVKDDDLDALHKEIKKNGMNLCPFNFYNLCQYILTIIREQYIILLKPNISETLTELSDVISLTFTNADGRKAETNNIELIRNVMANIDVSGDRCYIADRIVRVDMITDKILIQSSFTYLVALFLKEYFKDYPRRANCCMVSAIEQKLILYMLYFFGLAPAPLTDSRFRQLIAYFKAHQTSVSYSNLPNVGIVPLEVVKYGDWKDGNIKLDKLEHPIEVGDTITIPEGIKIERNC